jgi:hypothetical protein
MKEVVSMLSRKLTRFIAAGAAAVAVAIGGVVVSNSSSSNGASGTAKVAQAPAPGQASQSGVPQNWRPGTGTIITGAAAEKAKAAALAKYPGTVNRVLQLSDGSYAVHMFATSAPHHVFLSKDFKVTGAQ